jgi:hypothetical protein
MCGSSPGTPVDHCCIVAAPATKTPLPLWSPAGLKQEPDDGPVADVARSS